MPQRFFTIDEASDFLLGYSPEKMSGETYTLGRMQELMSRLGNPQNDIPAIHVAGTSGKTSTSYYLRSILQAQGFRTGLTSSPHIRSITERVQVNGSPLDDGAFLRYLDEFMYHVEEWRDLTPTYFELLTAFAFWVFKQEQLDYMVIEVGLGGLLDATNVITGSQKVSVITPIGLDHTEILGNSIERIAMQKAGIITADSDVFIGQQDPKAQAIIIDRARQLSAHIHTVETHYDSTDVIPLFQQQNFSVARAAVEFIARRDGFELSNEDALRRCMFDNPPGRFEVYKIRQKTIILDGAHNPQKLAAFMQSLTVLHEGPFAWLIGFINAPDDKIDECLRIVVNSHDNYIVTEFSVGQDIKGRKSVSARSLGAKLATVDATHYVEPNAYAALELLLSSKQRTVIVTGSLYLVALLREQVIALPT